MTDAALSFTDEIHVRLVEWGAWARNHSIKPSTENMLAKMMRRKDQPCDVMLTTDDMTLEHEIIEKAIARMQRIEGDRRLKRVLMKYYVGLRSYFEIAADLRTNESEIKRLHLTGIRVVSRHYERIETLLVQKIQFS